MPLLPLLEQIRQDQVTARKTRTRVGRVSLLTTLLSEASRVGMDDGKRQSTDAEVVLVIKKFIKGCDEILAVDPASTHAEWEKAVLEEYLPTQKTGSELEQLIKGIIADTSILEPKMKMMGPVMKTLKENFGGEYDGKEASTVVKRILSK